jgi:hypothetical protein
MWKKFKVNSVHNLKSVKKPGSNGQSNKPKILATPVVLRWHIRTSAEKRSMSMETSPMSI